MSSSIWSSKYVTGGVTGFCACSNYYLIGGMSGLLSAAILITIAAAWYHTGRRDQMKEEVEFLKGFKETHG